jgi:hypothetical protein
MFADPDRRVGARFWSIQVGAAVGRYHGGGQEVPHSVQRQPNRYEGTSPQVRRLSALRCCCKSESFQEEVRNSLKIQNVQKSYRL